MTRVTFSDNGQFVDITLPKTWAELSQAELYRVYSRIVAQPDNRNALFFAIFRSLTGCNVERNEGGRWLLRFRRGRRVVRVWVTPMELIESLECLSFVERHGDVPCRLEHLSCSKRSRAVDARLHGVTFETYLQIESLYQGFIASGKYEALQRLARLLYPGLKAGVWLDEVDTFNILNWMVQVKAHFAAQFSNLFKPAGSGSTAPNMLEVINNQVRVLTGGDITKENEVFAADCWRSLTELDYKARESEEMRRQLEKAKSRR